jgi:membrane protease YdiL (CAAX protease family)
LSEEVVFRFYLINLFLLRRRSLAMAVLLSTLIFAVIHWSYGPGVTIFAALAGLIFASLYIATGNLAGPVIAHAGFDSVVFAGAVGALCEFTARLRSARRDFTHRERARG